MTITLEGNEALEYIKIKNLLQEDKENTSPKSQKELYNKEPKNVKRAVCPGGIVRKSVSRPKWKKWKLNKVYDALYTSTALKCKLNYLMSQLPNRTEAAIRSKVYELGGYVTAGIVHKHH